MTQDQDLVGTPEFIEQFFVPWHSPGNPWDGLPMARIGWRLQMYWREPASPAKRRALLAITEEYLDRAAGQLQRYVVGGGPENFIFLKPGERPNLEPLRAITNEGNGWYFTASGAVEPNEAHPWAFHAASFQSSYRADEYADLLAYFPVTGFGNSDAVRQVVSTFQRWCSMVQADQGYAGLGWVFPNAVGTNFGALRRIGALALRFEGLDADEPSDVLFKCREGLRWPTWLNAVSDRLLERAGGALAVANTAGPEITTHAYTGGTIFQAGAYPQFGDTTQGLQLPAYRAVARALKPLRANYAARIFNVPPDDPQYQDMDEPDARRAYARRWTNRFDVD